MYFITSRTFLSRCYKPIITVCLGHKSISSFIRKIKEKKLVISNVYINFEVMFYKSTKVVQNFAYAINSKSVINRFYK